jgi:predicted nuclease of predicted toxin-antitoxin system
LRLLLDEMYPYSIAEQLGRKGHDAQAVTARAELRALSDVDLFARAQEEHRAVVTENVADFCRIADDMDRGGQPHHGLVLVDPTTYPRGASRTIGRLVTALDRLMEERAGERADSRRDWL